MQPVSWALGAFAAAAAMAAARLWMRRGWGSAAGAGSLRGRTVLVTGATGGLGGSLATRLAARGARVLLAVRDVPAARLLIQRVRHQHPGAGEMIAMHLDLASLESIRSFANLVKTGFSKIDILVNNAGVYLPLKLPEKSADGYEMHFAVNHLGHFLLTNLLLDLLKNAAPSRIVVVSSLLHERGVVDFDDLNLTKTYAAIDGGDKAVLKRAGRHNPGYCNSKLMNVYFARGLAERTKKLGIDVFAVCPGFVYTKLFRHTLRWYHYILMAPVLLLYMRTPEEGIQTILHCALEPSLQGKSGGFYRNCVPYHSKVIFEKEIEEKLWKTSEELVQFAYSEADDPSDVDKKEV